MLPTTIPAQDRINLYGARLHSQRTLEPARRQYGVGTVRPSKRAKLAFRAGETALHHDELSANATQKDLVQEMLSSSELEGDPLAALKTNEAFWKVQRNPSFSCRH